MAPHITGPEVVNYSCTCGLLKPISQLYFCRYCCELRCGFCVCHEVDSHFCGKCSENLPSSEARLKRNRCGNCFNCPSCRQELSTRVAAKSAAATDDPKTPPKKSYYLACLFCHWSSRDVGIPDQTVVSGAWPERENVHANRLQDIIDKYKAMVLADKQRMEREKKKQRNKYISYTERTGVTQASLRRRLGLPQDMSPLLQKLTVREPDPATATEDVPELPEALFNQPVDLLEVTTLRQRFLQPDSQPETTSLLFPVHKQLSIKRSLRCRSCEHNVSKPEFNPSSVKFKIQLFAYYHIPEVRIVTVEPLREGRECELIVKFTNPTQHQTTVAFLPIDHQEEPSEMKETIHQSLNITEIKSTDHVILSSTSQPTSLLNLPSRQPSITVRPRPLATNPNADMVLPESTFVLPPRDDAAEYDDSAETQHIQDDPKLVIRRKSNKAFVRLYVKPRSGLEIGTELVTAFTMQHVYTNTIASTAENKEPQKFKHCVKVFLVLGNLVGSE